jgi:DNA polymerase
MGAMGERVKASELSRAEAMGLLAWWVEAGVDTAVQEEPRDWRVRSSPVPQAPLESANVGSSQPPAPIQQVHTLPRTGAEPFQTLDTFHAWLAESADLPLFRAGAARALPHGPAYAELMLVTGIPSPEDAGEGRPIGGAAWALAERMMRAIGIAPDAAYVAALTCFSGTGSQFSAADTDACRETMLAQIRLAAPKRLLLLGDQPAKLLLGLPMASARGKRHRVGGVPAVVTFPPRYLLQNSQHKALAWADLLLLMGE